MSVLSVLTILLLVVFLIYYFSLDAEIGRKIYDVSIEMLKNIR